MRISFGFFFILSFSPMKFGEETDTNSKSWRMISNQIRIRISKNWNELKWTSKSETSNTEIKREPLAGRYGACRFIISALFNQTKEKSRNDQNLVKFESFWWILEEAEKPVLEIIFMMRKDRNDGIPVIQKPVWDGRPSWVILNPLEY